MDQSKSLDNLAHGLKFRNRYRKVVWLLRLFTMTALALAVVLLLLLFKPQHPKFYATTTAGVVEQLQPLNQPATSLDFIQRWSKLAVRSAYSLDFISYDKTFERVASKFTPDGMASFRAALNSSGLLNDVISKQLIMSTIVTGPAVVLFKGDVRGVYTWRIQMPILINFESASVANYKKRYIVTLSVVRVPSVDAPYSGVEISKLYTTTRV